MPSVHQAVEVIINRTGIQPHIVTQSARRLREDEVLPISSGCKPAQIGAEHLALLLFASLTTQIVKDSTRKALNYGALVVEGGALDAGGPPTTLLTHFAALIDNTWINKTPRLEFESLTLDLMTPGATVTSKFPDDVVLHATFVPPDTDASDYRSQLVRRETVLTREVFMNIMADLRKLDDGIRRRTVPFQFTIH
jgi:hypothetical protein